MQPQLLTGDRIRVIFFPNEAGTIISKSQNATIYIGANADTKEKVILKKISTVQFGNDSQRFKFFATIANEAKLDGLVDVQDIVFDDSDIYLVCANIPGRTLKDLIYDQKYLDYRNDIFFLRIISNCLETLSFIHKLKLSHGNLRPENIIVEWDECEEFDFLHPKARILSTENIKLGFKNMPLIRRYDEIGYKSPEQLLGFEELVGDYSDIYSMGIIMYECLAREALYDSSKQISRRQQIFGKIEQHYRINEYAYKIIEKATVKPFAFLPGSVGEETQRLMVVKALNERYQSVVDFKKELDEVINNI